MGIWSKHKYLILIIILAIALRFFGLGLPNFYFDENIQAHASERFVFDGVQPWIITNFHPPAYTWFTAPLTFLLGPGELSLRLTGAIFGILAIFFVYFLSNKWFGKKTAILSALLLTVTPIHVIYSRLGFGEIGATAIVVASIILMEHILSVKDKKTKYYWLIAYGVLIGLIFLTRYVTLNLLFYYWAFLIGYPAIKKDFKASKAIFKQLFFSAIFAIIFFFGMTYLTGGVERIIYAIHNIIMLILQQSTVYSNPWFFHVVTLFDSLSPLMYILLPISAIYLISRKERKGEDMLLVILVVAFFVTLSLQARRYTRHELIIIPFAVILIARSLILMKERKSINKRKYWNYMVLMIVLSGLFWSVYQMARVHDFNVWHETAEYIDKNYPENVVVHSGFIKHWPAQNYIKREVDSSRKTSALKLGDLVIFTILHDNTTIMENSPLEEKSTLWKRKPYKDLDYSKQFEEYVLDHGKLIKEFKYKGGTALWLYEITSTGRPVDEISEIDPLLSNKFFGMWDFICEKWDTDSTANNLMQALFSKTQKEEITKKCSSFNSI